MDEDETTWGPPDVRASEAAPIVSGARRRRRAPIASIVVVAAVVVGLGALGLVIVTRGDGKGGSDRVTSQTRPGPPPAAVLGAAPAASRAAGTARIRTSMQGFEAGSTVHEVVEGGVGFDSGAFDLTYTMDGGGPLFPAAPGGGERVFSDGATIWSAIPPYMDMFPQAVSGKKTKNPFTGKKYLAEKVGPRAIGSAPGFNMLGPQALGFSIGTAPGDVLAYLNGVGGAVREGKESLDGEDVTRYGADLDLDALQRALPKEERSFDAYDFKADVAHSLPAKVWLDGAGRLRKLTYRLDLSALLTDAALKADYLVQECSEPDQALAKKAAAGDKKAMATLMAQGNNCPERPARPEELVIEGSVEVSAYGTPLTVAPPPAAEVLTSEKFEAFLATQAGSALGGLPLPPAKP